MRDTVLSGSYGPDPRPPEAEIAQAARALGFAFEQAAVPPLGVRGLLELWKEMSVNGGGFSASFALTGVQPAADWCLRNGRLDQLDYARRLLGSSAMTAALPDHSTDKAMLRQARFTDLHPLQLEGDLALKLVHGGAHRRFPGTTAQARAVAADAAAELIEDRYENVSITASHDGWAPWFGWVAWDRTWIITDRDRRVVTVIALTDTD